MHTSLNELRLPAEFYDEFLQDSVRKNRQILRILCVLIIVVELFNIIRVLLLSDSGLSTWNNRIYFSFYLSLLFLCLVLLILDRVSPSNLAFHYQLHFYGALLLMFWNAGLNFYDVSNGSNDNITVIATALLGMSVLFQAVPARSAILLLSPYAFFLFTTWGSLTSGCKLNLTVTVSVGLIVSMAHFRFVLMSMQQERNIRQINQELREEREKLRMSLEQHQIIMEQASDIMMHWDLEQDMMSFSRNWTELSGYPMVIPNFLDWLTETQSPRNGQKLAACFQAYRGGEKREERISLCMADGEVRWYQIQMVMQADRTGKPVEGVGVLRDISRQQSEIEQLQNQLQYDTLTGILNKHGLELYTQNQLELLSAHKRLTFLMLDMDDFKRINDTFGHPCGDHVLQETARFMKHTFRTSDGMGRIGGDEFIVVIPGLSDEPLIRQKVQQLMDSIRDITWNGAPVNASSSVGGIIVSGPDHTFRELYRAADAALYQAKSAGKNQLHLACQE